MDTLQPEDREALRQEIQAAIAAGREVDPAMDAHLADSVLDRYASEKTARDAAQRKQQPVPVVPPQSPQQFRSPVWLIGSVMSLASIVAIFMFVPNMWWLIFIVPPIVGSMFGWSRQHDSNYLQRRELQHQYRMAKTQMKVQYMQNRIKRMQQEEI